jgi:hypothetical protein
VPSATPSRHPAPLLGALACAAAAAAVLWVGAEPGGSDGRLFFGLWRTRHLGVAGGLAGLGLALACAWISRRALFAFASAALLAGVTGAILEAAGQLGLVDYAALLGNRAELQSNAVGSEPQPHLDVEGVTFQDTATAWGLASDPVPFRYRTDARGFRNAHDRDAGDVYLLGDSVVVAGLVPFDETLTARLEAALDRPVVNVALIGIGPERQHALFREAGLPVERRLVLQLLFEGNDLIDPAPGEAAPEPGLGERLRRRSFTAQLVLAAQRWTQPVVGLARRRTCRIAGRDYAFHWAFQSWAGLEHRQAPVLEAMARFGREVEAAGGRYGVVFVPSKLRVLGPACERWPAGSDLVDAWDANPLRATAHAWAESQGIALVDLTGPLRAAARAGRVPWFWGDTHWNATGHAVAARALLASPVLAGHGPAPGAP